MRRWYAAIFVISVLALVVWCIGKDTRQADSVSERVHAFYYPWWGTPEVDGDYFHWKHDVLGEVDTPHTFPGGQDIGADFYPQLGCYSTNDESVLRTHMHQLRSAGVGVMCVSWWWEGSFEDKTLPKLLDVASEYGIKVNFHIEPIPDRNAAVTKEAIIYLIDTYGSHEAFYRDGSHGNRPVFYIYDSYKTPVEDWASILTTEGSHSIRGAEYDAIVLALWVEPHEEAFILDGGFDGFYTYFAADGFSYGSTPANWPRLARWAEDNCKLFVPCVGPGYCDTRIRPWNAANTKEREEGAYYDRMFSTAIKTSPTYIGITSFNEWHEGTQIEPAVPKEIEGFQYRDYSPLEPDYYLNRTRFWIDRWERGDIESLEHGAAPDATIDHLGVGKPVTLLHPCSPKYDGGSRDALIDGIFASENYRDGKWVGFEGNDLVATVDLGELALVSSFSTRLLENTGAWIFPPQSVTLECSPDGIDYDTVFTQHNTTADGPSGPDIHTFATEFKSIETHFVRVTVENVGVCPDWHPGAGGKAWLFVDEIVIE